MKNSKFIKFSIVALLPVIIAIGSFLHFDNNTNIHEVDAYKHQTLSTMDIDLNSVASSDIRNYYNSLEKLSDSERKGTNLLKNLKPILKTNQKYYSYDSGSYVWQMYEITDRDWDLSPASAVKNGKYNASTNVIENYEFNAGSTDEEMNPYVRALYVDRTMPNPMKAFGNHQQTYGGINREHIWPKSHGFDTKLSESGGARGDPMHLWAADGKANNLHNNHSYGFVNKSLPYDVPTGIDYAHNNYLGTSLTLGSGTVFEPQDSDKGDVARALFYMAARYNNFAGETSGIDANDPNLVLDDYVTRESGTSTASKPFKYGVLSDLLEWNKLDPVDDYEIKRNDILYRNFTNNRNPFIDFPEWADYIWGEEDKVATPSTDVLNGQKGSDSLEITKVEITSNPHKMTYEVGETFNTIGMVVTATYSDDSTKIIRDYTYSQVEPFNAIGSQKVQITYKTFKLDLTVNVVKKEPPEEGTYSFTITTDDFTGSGYAANNHEKTSIAKMINDETKTMEVNWYSNNVQKNTGISWKARDSYIINTTNLCKIKGIKITSTKGTYTKYFGRAMKPNDNENAGGKYFTILNSSDVVAKATSIVVTYEINSEPELLNISLSGNQKTAFEYGETFNSSGLVVKANYSNGTSVDVTSSCLLSEVDMNEVGPQEVVVTYASSDNQIYENSYEITITNPLTKIAISGTYKTSFAYGASFNHTGLKVIASYKDGSDLDVTSRCSFSSPNMKQVGEQTITITYNEDGKTYTTTYKINIVNAVKKIVLSGDYQTEFYEGEYFNYDGLIVTATYADGSSREITSGYEVIEPDEFKLGKNKITVSFEGCKAYYYIEVIENPIFDLIGGCLGSVVAPSFIVFALACTGVALLIVRKKHKKG